MTGTEGAVHAARTYETSDIETSNPIGRVLRVFELAGSHLARARGALRDGDLAEKGLQIGRASRCLGVLQASLDMEQGGAVARDLDRLYTYLTLRLTRAHIDNDDAGLREVADALGELGGAWREVLRRPRAEVVGLQAAAVR